MENFIIPEIRQAVFSGQKVLSTIQLAAIFKCKRNNITDNFRNHKAEFVNIRQILIFGLKAALKNLLNISVLIKRS